MTPLPGITGSLFPSRFLATGLSLGDKTSFRSGPGDESQRQLLAWWRSVETTCGPATGLRTIFDLVAMPLAGMLGFRAHDAIFERTRVRARLTTRHGGTIGLIVLPWAARPSRIWRDLADTARASNASWCLIVAPPFLSIVDARGHALRRSVDFRLPDALDDRSFSIFWALSQAQAFSPGFADGARGATAIDLLVSRGALFQDAVRRDLQQGVVAALGAIGPALPAVRNAPAIDRFSEALTLVYRVLFLLFAESRELVPRHHPAYGPAYAIGSLCRHANQTMAERTGLWEAVAAVTRLSRTGCDSSDLIVRPFNGKLFARASAPSLELRQTIRQPTRASRQRDDAIATALSSLGTRHGPSGREEISYADLGVEQLGAVYERVLDLDPRAFTERHQTQSETERGRHSRRRKETGTFYTPQPLAEYVVRRTLAPLVRDATPDQILALRVVDPAMGSGAFLVAACRYLAHAYEGALLHEGRVAETDLDDGERANIRRLIAGRCLAGVDANPTAVQLARLSLWLTTLARDKPLNFLDDRLRIGDSLIGASPDDLWRSAGRRTSASGRSTPLFDVAGLDAAIRDLAQPLRQLREAPDDTVADVRAKERGWVAICGESSPLDKWRLACSMWCGRWFWPVAGHGRPPSAPEISAAIDALLRGDQTLRSDKLREWIAIVRSLARSHGFFHWPLEFSGAFYSETGEPRATAGFDAVIGNPPWEVLRKEPGDDPSGDRRAQTLEFIRGSGLYPSCDRGHLNLYQPFLERSLSITRAGGRVGLVLPWGMATDDGSASLRARLLDRTAVDSIVGLDNAEGIFPIHRGLRFMVLVTSPGSPRRDIRARFGVRRASDIDELAGEDEPGDRSGFPVRLSPAIIRSVGGHSHRIPDARRAADLDWLYSISQYFPRLGAADGWRAEFGRELNATEDRPSFGARGLPIIDGKHITPFVVQVAPDSHRIAHDEARRLLPDERFVRERLGYRDVSGATNRYSLIAAIIPANVVTTHTLFCLRTPLPLEQQQFLCGLFNSSTLNSIVRMLMGGHVTTSLVESLPMPAWAGSIDQLRIGELAGQLGRNVGDESVIAELNDRVATMYRCSNLL